MTKTDQSFFKQLVGEVVEEKLDQRLAKLEERLSQRLDERIDKVLHVLQDKVLTKMDSFIKEIRDYRVEQSGHQIQHDDIRSELDLLNKIHPQGRHASL